MEVLFFNQKNFFPSRNIEIFVFLFSPLFFPVGRCWIYRRNWLKVNPKDYDVIMCLS